MPSIDSPAVPGPSDTQKMAAIPTAASADHIPQWAVKGLLALLALVFIPGSIATVSYIVGGIHSRLSENEKAIQTLKEERAAFSARLDVVEGVDTRQWQLMSENKEKVASHHHSH